MLSAKIILRLWKGEELLFWIVLQIMELIFFWTNVHQCNIAFSVVHVQVVLNIFIYQYYYIYFLQTKVAANSMKRICVYGWLVRIEKN